MLVADARGTTDEGRRRELYGEAQRLMNRDVPSIIPVFFDLLGAQRDWVEGYELHPRGAVFRLDFVSLGWLTHSAPALDLSLLLEPLP